MGTPKQLVLARLLHPVGHTSRDQLQPRYTKLAQAITHTPPTPMNSSATQETYQAPALRPFSQTLIQASVVIMLLWITAHAALCIREATAPRQCVQHLLVLNALRKRYFEVYGAHPQSMAELTSLTRNSALPHCPSGKLTYILPVAKSTGPPSANTVAILCENHHLNDHSFTRNALIATHSGTICSIPPSEYTEITRDHPYFKSIGSSPTSRKPWKLEWVLARKYAIAGTPAQ